MQNHPPNPYNEPTFPGGYPYTPPPPRPPNQLRFFLAWFRRQKPFVRVIVILAMLAGPVFFCSAAVSGIVQGAQSTATPTPTTVSVHVAQSTDAPTSPAQPTATTKPAATPIPTPTQPSQPTQTPATPTPNRCPNAVNGNPWCYDFNAGTLIYNPPSGFCGYFNCISSFWSGSGYVVECQDATYSKSGGHTGSCSHHGGDLRPLYAH